MFAYFLWLNSEGRDKIKVYFRVHHIQVKISCIVGGEPRLWRDIVIKLFWVVSRPGPQPSTSLLPSGNLQAVIKEDVRDVGKD